MHTLTFPRFRRRSLFRSFAASLALLFAAPLCAAPETEEGWKPLFTGTDLSGWAVPAENPFWKVEDGVLTGTNDEKLRGNMLFTEAEYGDFILEAEAKWDGEIDSGFALRKPELQLQIGFSSSLQTDFTGSFYTGGKDKYPEAGQTKGLAEVMKPGDWNHFRLEARGTKFTVWMNGKETVSGFDAPKFSGKAPIGLQIHQGRKMSISFRNLRIKEL